MHQLVIWMFHSSGRRQSVLLETDPAADLLKEDVHLCVLPYRNVLLYMYTLP